ncbi:MAG: hypothetical protein WDO68_22045 [Gammaproteobacteria bacterium]
MFLAPTIALAQDGLSARERILACDPKVAMAAAREILKDPRTLNVPLEMFTPSFVLFQGGSKDEALFWFYAAQVRSRYQLAFKNGDRGQILQVMMAAMAAPINNYGFSDPENMRRTLDRVLQWDSQTANALRDGMQTVEQRDAVSQIYAGVHELQRKLIAEGPALAKQAKQTAYLQDVQNDEKEARCSGGQVDPSLAGAETKKEQARVLEMVQKDPEVLRAAGPLKDVSIDGSTMLSGATMPSHYRVYARGDKTIFAEVDVTRSGSSAQLILRCTTSIAPGHRDAHADPCAK